MAIHKKGKRVTPDEEASVARLIEAKKSVATILRETGIGRSKIYELKNNPPPAKRRPANSLQQKLYKKCQLRSKKYPYGDHSWMNEERFGEAYTIIRRRKKRPASPDDVKTLGYAPLGWRTSTTRRECWFCGYTTKRVPTRWPIDPLASVF